MAFVKVIAIAIGLGMDAMSVCMAIGVRWHGRRQRFRLAWHMGLFQFLMPIVGWLAGEQLAGRLRSFGSYLAAVLVFGIGAKMLWEAIRAWPGAVEERGGDRLVRRLHVAQPDPTRGWSLVVLSVATSMDALVVGFCLGLKGDQQIWQASILIGVVAALMALAGVAVGKRAGEVLGRPAEIVGAAILMVLGISFLFL